LRKEDAEELLLPPLLERLDDLQERLFAENRRSLLVVLQGMDTSGKGGTIKTLGGALYPAGYRAVAFKVPTSLELAHDFLWRVHRETPRSGEIVFFDRSHYEDVLVVRVDKLVPAKVWRARYEQINAFERHLADNGTTIRKFFLHISREEQRERLKKRLENPKKQWKFSFSDAAKRKQWSAYMRAYRDAVARCDTSWASWIVVPSDHKWYRNLVVARELVRTLEAMSPRYPRLTFDPKKIRIS
jgi:PPK2 family polyphosphate:nucleotide phosphotransferase